MTDWIPDPAEELHRKNRFEARRAQSVLQKRKIDAAIDEVKLPKNYHWLDGSTVRFPDDTGSHITLDQEKEAWVAVLYHYEGGMPIREFDVKIIEFGWLTESASPGYIRERLEEALNDFQKEVAEGRAKRCQDGDTIPRDCRFRAIERANK